MDQQKFLRKMEEHLISDDYIVRDFVLHIMETSYLGTEKTFMLGLDANKKNWNERKTSEKLTYLKKLPMPDEGMRRLLADLRDETIPDEELTYYGDLLNHADPCIVGKFKEDIASAYKARGKKVQNLSFYTDLCTDPTHVVLQKLHTVINRIGSREEFNEKYYVFGKQMVELMARRELVGRTELMHRLYKMKGKRKLAVRDLYDITMAGELRLEAALPHIMALVDLHKKNDLFLEEFSEALVKIGTKQVVNAVRMWFDDARVGLYAVDIVANIKTEYARTVLFEAFEQEEKRSIKTMLAAGLCEQLSDEAIPLIESFMEEGYETMLLNLEEALYCNCVINGIDHPKLRQWRSTVEGVDLQAGTDAPADEASAEPEEFSQAGGTAEPETGGKPEDVSEPGDSDKFEDTAESGDSEEPEENTATDDNTESEGTSPEEPSEPEEISESEETSKLEETSKSEEMTKPADREEADHGEEQYTAEETGRDFEGRTAPAANHSPEDHEAKSDLKPETKLVPEGDSRSEPAFERGADELSDESSDGGESTDSAKLEKSAGSVKKDDASYYRRLLSSASKNKSSLSFAEEEEPAREQADPDEMANDDQDDHQSAIIPSGDAGLQSDVPVEHSQSDTREEESIRTKDKATEAHTSEPVSDSEDKIETLNEELKEENKELAEKETLIKEETDLTDNKAEQKDKAADNNLTDRREQPIDEEAPEKETKEEPEANEPASERASGQETEADEEKPDKNSREGGSSLKTEGPVQTGIAAKTEPDRKSSTLAENDAQIESEADAGTPEPDGRTTTTDKAETDVGNDEGQAVKAASELKEANEEKEDTPPESAQRTESPSETMTESESIQTEEVASAIEMAVSVDKPADQAEVESSLETPETVDSADNLNEAEDVSYYEETEKTDSGSLSLEQEAAEVEETISDTMAEDSFLEENLAYAVESLNGSESTQETLDEHTSVEKEAPSDDEASGQTESGQTKSRVRYPTNEPQVSYDEIKAAVMRLYQAGMDSQSRRKEIKVGRNEPCPCGSGKKYKKCCMRV
ncbi:SEC-C motif-containing protein [Salipaludibacillus aurantiacus]|uniref:SEC-C motif-containing protein n=1 Tax=Salipaludibacillus aurantiacus TaxID=1601833 RepID=A0A1H9U8I7_9BACI|nr:SEC-C motif-containing protein [Salipaludibacillus aurantiacus]